MGEFSGLVFLTKSFLASLLEQTYHMPLALALIGCVSRFHAILGSVTEDASILYNELGKLTFKTPSVFSFHTSNDKQRAGEFVEIVTIEKNFRPKESELLGDLPRKLVFRKAHKMPSGRA
jgi:hypothetical protein